MNTSSRNDRPAACHYDRALRMRVTRRHADDCPSLNGGQCPATDRGCQPCEQPHCLVCGREHTSAVRPDTCVECETKVATDLVDLGAAFDALADEATNGGGNSRLVAASPIPGGDAQVLRGPTVRLDQIRTTRRTTPALLAEDHRKSDPIPPLAVLAQWEDIYRTWLGHQPLSWRLASVPAAIVYLRDQLPYIANHATAPNSDRIMAPDWVAFTRQIRDLRAGLENRLHDERDDEQGVSCFECGDQLVRRFRPRQVCRHTTPAREALAARLLALPEAQALLEHLDEVRYRRASGDRTATAESIGRLSLWPTSREHAAALLPSPVEVAEAKLPCPNCTSQGGIDDPTAGHSWECPGCRKTYDPGEYVAAVRLDLAADNAGWPIIAHAAQAAATLTEHPVSEKTIRGWVEKGWVGSYMQATKTGLPGVRVVFWPDVRQEARRVAAGRNHCGHSTPAREWLAIVKTYPELEVWHDEYEAAREQCEQCQMQVDEALGGGMRHASVGRVS